ncbi:hypothetical protein JKA74_17820 [Marivirga sp. S37H4]|uniref:STAS/SEC14 domain-containing protein n=1 Tax=Marivirga aurantiaca TaxID=2802615 RepID=A0A935CAR0_9BACT|nr:hypothetical protein [Marivirga aurantiaca]MBK6266906.1 hypothetical protein [Marivirga aurantiaca]
MKFETKNNLNRVICTTEYQPENNWIYCNWEGYANVDAMKEWGLKFVDLLKKTKCSNLLNDDSKSTGPWTQAMEWIETILIPKVIDAGLKQYAHVVSENTFSEMSAKELNIKIGSTLEMATFRNVDDAKSWLIAKQEKVS